jgi:predicted AlkP superfamily pyrophosphatase or phosphodiesterase
MRQARWLTMLLILFATAATAGAPLAIVLSWDGMRYDYPDRAAFPGLDRMQREGLRAERLVAGWPSSTFPGHVTLATGAWAGTHGIVDNEFWDRQRGRYAYSSDASWLDAEPLWIAAERQGIRAATFFWVGSETDWHAQHQSYKRAPFDGSVPESVKVDQILAWIDLPPAQRPGLIMAYWHGADTIGHRRGPDSAAVVEQIYDQDRQLVRLLDGIDARKLWADTTLLIVSDHGMVALHDFFDIAGLLNDHGFTPHVYGGPGVVQLFFDDPKQIDGAFALLAAHPPLKVYRGSQLPDRYHLRHVNRTGDLVVISDPSLPLAYPSWWVRTVYAVMGPIAGWYAGSHGFDPALPEMGAMLLAMGRGVPAHARIGAVPMIDIAPTVTALLGIAPPLQSEGTAIAAIQPPAAAKTVESDVALEPPAPVK